MIKLPYLEIWIKWIVRFTRPVSILLLLMTGAILFYTISYWQINNITTTILDTEDLLYQSIIAEQRAFPDQKPPLLSIVIDANSGDEAGIAAENIVAWAHSRTDLFRTIFYRPADKFFKRQGLLYLTIDQLADLIDRLAEAQPFLASLAQDSSSYQLMKILATALDAAAESDIEPPRWAENLAFLVNETAATLTAFTTDSQHTLAWAEVIGGQAFGSSQGGSSRQVIIVQLHSPHHTPAAIRAALQIIRDQTEKMGLTMADGISVRLTGTPVLTNEMISNLYQGLWLFFGLIFGILACGLWIITGSFPAMIILLLGLFSGLVCMIGFIVILLDSIPLFVIGFGFLLLILFIDQGLYLGLHLCQSHLSIGRISISRVSILCLVTSLIGLFAYVFTPYQGLAEFALVATGGLIIGLFITFHIILTLFLLWRTTGAKDIRHFAPSANQVALRSFTDQPVVSLTKQFVSKHRLTLLIGLSVATGIALIPASRLQFNPDPVLLYNPDSEAMLAYQDLMSDVETRDDWSILLAPSLADADQMAVRLDQMLSIAEIRTLSDLVPNHQEQKLDLIETARRLLLPALLALRTSDNKIIRNFSISHTQRKKNTTMEQKLFGQALSQLQKSIGKIIASPTISPVLATAALRLRIAITKLIEQNSGRHDSGVQDSGTTQRIDLAPEDWQNLHKVMIAQLLIRLHDLTIALNPTPIKIDTLPDTVRSHMSTTEGTARIEIRPMSDMRDPAARYDFITKLQTIDPNVTGVPAIITRMGRITVQTVQQASFFIGIGIILLLWLIVRDFTGCLLLLLPLLLTSVLVAATLSLLGLILNNANIIIIPLLLILGMNNVIRSSSGQTWLKTGLTHSFLLTILVSFSLMVAFLISQQVGIATIGMITVLTLFWLSICMMLISPISAHYMRHWYQAKTE